MFHSKLQLSETSSFYFYPKYIDECDLIWQRNSSSKQNCPGSIQLGNILHCLIIYPTGPTLNSLHCLQLKSVSIYIKIKPSDVSYLQPLRWKYACIVLYCSRSYLGYFNILCKAEEKNSHSKLETAPLQSNQVKRFAQESRFGFVVQNLYSFFVRTSQL